MRILSEFAHSPAKLMRSLLLLNFLVSAACAADRVIETEVQGVVAAACRFESVSFSADFEGGKLDGCSQREDGSYELRFDPENAPINQSPWYAFRVSSRGTQEIVLHLTYSLHHHRYWPKLSADGRNWARASIGAVKVDRETGSASLRLHLENADVWVAGQELLDNDYYARWAASLAKAAGFERSVLGLSAQGRDIEKLERVAPANRYLVLLGRQHPPEVTGALALEHFVERLTEEDELALRFKEHFGVLLIPNLNPDGVAEGNWRHNTGGIDLNRDWGPFSQPETRLVRDEFSRFDAGNDDTLYLFLDFHSTRYDVLYTQLPDMVTKPEGFTWRWIDRLQAALSESAPGYPVIVKPGHNPDQPTSKAYMHATFGVPAITFELGDETPRPFIRSYSRTAAEQMMLELLDSL